MIVCDVCKTAGGDTHFVGVPTDKDPYGEDTHHCDRCQETYNCICDEVHERVKGIKKKAIHRRWNAWVKEQQ